MPKVFVAALSLFLSCADPDILTPCVPNAAGELCNGLDDTCDDRIDEGLSRRCETICGEGVEVCDDGAWVLCDAPKPEPELCDGLDNDCDPATPDGVDDSPPDNSRYCYTGPADTAFRAPCRPGEWSCVGGWLCSDVTPKAEICGNLIDEDCDGIVDNARTSTEAGGIDIAIIIDRSCSMSTSGAIDVTTGAVKQFMIESPKTTRFWLFDLPAKDGDAAAPTEDCPDRVKYRPCLVATATHALTYMHNTYGDEEPSYSAIVKVLGEVAWNPRNSHYILLFTDEYGQPGGLQWLAVRALQVSQLRVTVLTFTKGIYRADFEGIATQSGGAVYDLLRLSSTQLLEIFDHHIEPACNAP